MMREYINSLVIEAVVLECRDDSYCPHKNNYYFLIKKKWKKTRTEKQLIQAYNILPYGKGYACTEIKHWGSYVEKQWKYLSTGGKNTWQS